MRLAEGGGAVAVEPQHLGQRGDAVGPLPGLAGEGGRGLRDRAHVADVMVAAGRAAPRGSASRGPWCGTGCSAARPSPALERRHVDRPAEGARLAEAHVVDQDDQHVRAPWRAPSPRTAAGPWRCGRRASVIGGTFGSGIGRTVRSKRPEAFPRHCVMPCRVAVVPGVCGRNGPRLPSSPARHQSRITRRQWS